MKLTSKILKYLAGAGELTIDILVPAHPKSRLARSLLGLSADSPDPRKEQHRISSMLSHLRAQGLVQHSGSRRSTVWKLTRKGQEEVRRAELILPPKDGVTRIVTFDIPEKQRQKRGWLRTQLLACGFKPLQRSVWIGERPLPSDLIRKIDDLHLADFIHIIGTSHRGTLDREAKFD